MAKFRAKARAIELLGKNQIADLPTAITELWKNGYDAYGDRLGAFLYKKGYLDNKHDILTITDDGFGMSKDDIENKWIIIGIDEKTNGYLPPEEDRFGKEIRVPLGEKGIGRLSIAYLGSHMLLLSKRENRKIAALLMNWSLLENSNLYIDDVEIPIDECDSVNDLKKIVSVLNEKFLSNLGYKYLQKRDNKLSNNNLLYLNEQELKIVGENNGTIKIYNKNGNQPLLVLEAHKEEIIDLSYEPSRNELTSESTDETRCVWDLNTGRLVHKHTGKWEGYSDLRDKIYNEIVCNSTIPECVIEQLKADFETNRHGTTFLVFNPINEIVELGMKRDDEADSADEKNYLISALSGLFNTLDDRVVRDRKAVLGDDYLKYPRFMICRKDEIGFDLIEREGEFFTREEIDNCENWIKGHFDINGRFEGQIKAYNNLPIDYVHNSLKEKSLSQCGEFDINLAFWEGSLKNTSMSKEQWQLYEKKGRVFSGLYIYRDGFRVLPYGRTDYDFLDFEKRRTYNAGRYYFSHRKMIGYISITKSGNPKLIDKAGREGLVANDAYRQLKTVLRQFFVDVADEYYGKKSESRKQLIETRKRKERQIQLLKDEELRVKQEQTQIALRILKCMNKLEEIERELHDLNTLIQSSVLNNSIDQSIQEKVLQEFQLIRGIYRDNYYSFPSALDISQQEELYDSYLDYQDYYLSVGQMIDSSENSLQKYISNTKINDYFSIEIKEFNDRIRLSYNEDNHKLEKNYNRFLESLDKIYKPYIESIKLYQSIEKNKLTNEQVNRKLAELESLMLKYENEKETSIDQFIDYLSRINFGTEQLELLGAYRSSNARLREENSRVYELAQVGMAIEQQDHQFGALYSNIHQILNKIINNNKSEELTEDLILLNMSFQHLEDNYKKLQPLYRVSRKNKRTITGKDIESVIIAFYGEKMQKDGVSLLCSNEFYNSTVFSYESIIMPVYLNIINNALYWLGNVEKKEIQIFISDEGESVICNSGPKMKPYELERCFDMFYSKKPTGRGIGLYLAKTTLRSIGMDIYATNDPKYNLYNGACFVITNELLGED